MANSKQKQKKPNILVIWGDDIGITNLSCYSHGLMGYQTPNIDRIAKKACCSQTLMANSLVQPVARPSLPDKAFTAPAYPK